MNRLSRRDFLRGLCAVGAVVALESVIGKGVSVQEQGSDNSPMEQAKEVSLPTYSGRSLTFPGYDLPLFREGALAFIGTGSKMHRTTILQSTPIMLEIALPCLDIPYNSSVVIPPESLLSYDEEREFQLYSEYYSSAARGIYACPDSAEATTKMNEAWERYEQMMMDWQRQAARIPMSLTEWELG